MTTFPRIRFVGDSALLIEFGERIDPAIHARVVALDQALNAEPIPGVVSLTPAYASLLVEYDPLVTDIPALQCTLEQLSVNAPEVSATSRLFTVPVCYDPPYAPDLAHVAETSGLTPEGVIAAHLGSRLRVYMYGFAPGFAYLGGLATSIRRPRRTTPVRDVPAGSVIIAGEQCIVTTFPMATGWWIIGRSPAKIFRPEEPEPVLFGIGDEVCFERVGSETLVSRHD